MPGCCAFRQRTAQQSAGGKQSIERRAAAALALRDEDVRTLSCPLAYALKLVELQPLYVDSFGTYDACKEEIGKELDVLHNERRRALLAEPRPRKQEERFLQFWGGCDFFDDDDYVGTSSVVQHMTPGVYDAYFWIACDSGIIGTNCRWDDDEWDYNEILAFLGGR